MEMQESRTTSKRQLGENAFILSHKSTDASFQPDIYSISIPGGIYVDLNEVRALFQTDPDSSEQDLSDLLFKTLTFFHELNHLINFTGSKFGFFALRSMETCVLSFIFSHEFKRMHPELEFSRLSGAIDPVEDFVSYYVNELYNKGSTAHECPSPEARSAEQAPGAAQRRESITIAAVVGQSDIVRRSREKPKLREPVQLFLDIPIPGPLPTQASHEYQITRISNGSNIVTKFNTASLLEAYSVIQEIVIITNTIPGSTFPEQVDRLLPHLDDLYGGALRLYLNYTTLPVDEMQIILPAIIDIALMHGGGRIKDSYSRNENGIPEYQSPVEYFFRGLAAAEQLGPAKDYARKIRKMKKLDLACQLYQDALCKSMGIHSTKTQTKRVIREILKNAPPDMFVDHTQCAEHISISDNIYDAKSSYDYRIPLACHVTVLQNRLKSECFFIDNIAIVENYNIFREIEHMTWIVNSSNGEISNRSLIPMSARSAPILVDLLSQSDAVTCPFQRGEPHFCGAQRGAVCWKRPGEDNLEQEPLQACPFYILGGVTKMLKGNQRLQDLLSSRGFSGCSAYVCTTDPVLIPPWLFNLEKALQIFQKNPPQDQ